MSVAKRLSLCLVLSLATLLFETPDCRADGASGAWQIEVEVQFVEFTCADITPLAAKGIIGVDSLRALQAKGKGKLLSAPKLVTQSGAEATFKVVTEYIYPTELRVCPRTGPDTNAVAVTDQFALVPNGFETREVGVILSVLPEMSRDGSLINLTMTPELVAEPDWKKYTVTYTDAHGTERESHLEQPFFHTRSISTSLSLYNGATVLVGGGAPPDEEKEKMLYIFVTARIVDAGGKLIDAE